LHRLRRDGAHSELAGNLLGVSEASCEERLHVVETETHHLPTVGLLGVDVSLRPPTCLGRRAAVSLPFRDLVESKAAESPLLRLGWRQPDSLEVETLAWRKAEQLPATPPILRKCLWVREDLVARRAAEARSGRCGHEIHPEASLKGTGQTGGLHRSESVAALANDAARIRRKRVPQAIPMPCRGPERRDPTPPDWRPRATADCCCGLGS